MEKFIKSNSINAVGAGQTATLTLSTGNLYKKLTLNYTASGVLAPRAVMEADITEIRLKINGKVQRAFSATQLFIMNVINGQDIEDGRIEIFFSEPWRRSADGEEALAWGTAHVATFQVEVDIAAGALAPTLSAGVVIDKDNNRNMGPIMKYRRRLVDVTSTGIRTVTDFDKQNAYYRIFCFTADIAGVKVSLDQEDFLDGTVAELNSYYSANGLTVPAGTTLIAFDGNQRISSALPMYKNKRQVSEFKIEFDMAVATSFQTLSQIFGFPD